MTDLRTPPRRRPLWRELYVQVFAAMLAGAVLGALAPAVGTALKPLGDAFIALVKMMIAPIVFCTVVHGIGSMRDMGRVGRIGLKALVYFELVSTLALLLGLLAGHLLHPGAGFGGHESAASLKAAGDYVERAREDGVVKHLLAIIPTSFGDALARGDLLQTLLVAILAGAALTQMGELGGRIAHGVEQAGQLFFRIIGIIVHVAPLGAFGAMAYTVGAFGAGALVNLAQLVGAFALVALLFILGVLGTVAALAGFSILRFLGYLREELLLVLGTSSSETALPGLMRKLEGLGVSEPVVGLVVPTGYSFNLDGTNIYMTLAILFLAQATGTDLSWGQEAAIVGISMLTSKGASGVTGAGFVTLAATLTIIPDIPVASIGMLLGIDRFMSLGRSLTNLVGNGVATVVIARWEGELDRGRLATALRRAPPSEVDLAAGPAA